MKTGNVVSVSGSYGFVRDEEGISYYFNQRDLQGGARISDIAIGDKLTFSPKAGPKGMIASGARKVESYPLYEAGKKLIFSKKPNPFRAHELMFKETFIRIQTMWYSSPDAARSQMDEVVESTGANAVINAQMLKDTWNDGNYYYSMHSYVADVGVYFVAKQVQGANEAQQGTARSEEQAMMVKQNLAAAKEHLDKRIEEQLKSSSFAMWFLFLLAVPFILFILFLFSVIT